MHITFKYDAGKDAENFLKSASAVNSKKPTKLQRLYREKYGTDPEPEHATAFIIEYQKAHQINLEQKRQEIEAGWQSIEPKVIERMERIFGITYPHDLTAYFSTNSRCRYDISSNYFFVHLKDSHPNGTIVHELLHFYTWAAFHQELEQGGISSERYNDIKEALTVLLNMEFADLLGNYEDVGYPQHADLRKHIQSLWLDSHDLKKVITGIAQ